MVVPLVVLAFLSFTGGWIGVPEALGGSNRFENFSDPYFTPQSLPALKVMVWRQLLRKKRRGRSRTLVMRPS